MMAIGSEKLRYLLVGGLCAGLNLVILVGGAWLGLHYAAALVLSYAVVVVVGYEAHARITFEEPRSLAAFGRYALAMLANLPLSYLCLLVLCDGLKLSVSVAAPLTTGLMFAANYVLSRWTIVGRLTGQRRDGARA